MLTMRAVQSLLRPTPCAKCMSFKSSISLDKLYPESVLVKKFEPPVRENGRFSGFIPIEQLVISYTRSSGPGGQHVNTTETKVDLRFHVPSATWISDETKQNLLKKHLTKINKDGFLIIRSEKTRYKQTNLADAMTRLRDIIYALEEPKTEPDVVTEEKIRKNKEKATRLRLMDKRMKAETKFHRQTSAVDL